MASSAVTALANAAGVSTARGRSGACASAAARRPVATAWRRRAPEPEGAGSAARQHQPQRLGEAGHGGRRSHHHAGAAGRAQLLLHLLQLGLIQLAGAELLPVGAAVGAGAQPRAAPGAGPHRPGDQGHGRNVGGGGRHQLRRHRLVAAPHQHRRVHRVGGQRLLGLHREQVAVEHGGGRDQDLSQRQRRQGERQRAALQHAAPHRFHQRRHVAVAGGVVGAGIDDGHHRAPQVGPVVAGRGQERPPQEGTEAGVPVGGQASIDAPCGSAHRTGRLAGPDAGSLQVLMAGAQITRYWVNSCDLSRSDERAG